MFFFGVRSKSIKKGTLTHVHCEYCDEESAMEYDFQQKYFHFYFIPFIPLKKQVLVCCENCDTIIEEKYQYRDIEIKLNRVKERYPIRTPLWAFSGVIILALFFVWAFWQSDRYNVKELEYIDNPQKGDVYFIESNPKKYTSVYTTMRIDKATKDSVYVTYNDTAVTKYTEVFGILNQDYYTTKKGVYSKAKILKWFQKDSIFSITRK